MQCYENVVSYLSYGMLLAGLGHLVYHREAQASYGRYMKRSSPARTVPARVAWFLQEMPALLMPLLLMQLSHHYSTMGRALLLKTFCLHYFQRWAALIRQITQRTVGLLIAPQRRTFVYSLLTRGQPFPLSVMASAAVFCSLNGFLQGHYLLHCVHFDDKWSTGYRYIIGLLVFYTGMAINVHSDHILRNLRKPKEIVYAIPAGGLFEYVSGANYFGEIVEWCGYAIATWSLPAFAIAVFSLCFIGPRAFYHHRFYKEHFEEYPKFRKALIPFIF